MTNANPNPDKRLDNLKHNFTHEERVSNGSKGGIATGETYRRRKLFKEALESALSLQDPEALEGMDQTNLDVIIASMIKKAKNGDVPAAVFVRDTVGEKPVDRQEVEVGDLRKLEVEIKE